MRPRALWPHNMRGVGEEESSLKALVGRNHINPSTSGYDSPITISFLTSNPGHIPWPQLPVWHSRGGKEGFLLDLHTAINDEPVAPEPTPKEPEPKPWVTLLPVSQVGLLTWPRTRQAEAQHKPDDENIWQIKLHHP